MLPPTRPGPSAPAPRFGVVWICTFLAFVAAGTVWNLAQPPLSTADEGQHFLEAQAVWSGQFLPRLVPAGGAMEEGVIRVHNIVGATVDKEHGFKCFNYDLDRSAACFTLGVSTTTRKVNVKNYVAREPPVASLLNGLPAAIDPDGTGFFLSRLLDTLLTAACLATAIAVCVSRRRPLLVAAIVVAFTPCALAESGAIGSSQLEVATAILTWTAVALLLDGEALRRRFVALLAVASTLFVVSRPISLVWVAVAAATILVASDRARLGALLAPAVSRIGLAVVGLASVAALLWAAFAEAPATPHTRYVTSDHIPAAVGQRISIVIGSAQTNFIHMIGDTGGDYPGPWWTAMIWTALIGTLVLTGLALAPRRRALTIGGLVAAFFVISFAIQVWELPKIGYFWHGRYDLPTLAGLVIVGSSPLDGALGRLPELARLGPVVIGAAALAQVMEFAGALRRFVVGIGGPLDPLHWSGGWHPPINSLLLLAVGVAVIAATYGLILLWLRRSQPEGRSDLDGALLVPAGGSAGGD